MPQGLDRFKLPSMTINPDPTFTNLPSIYQQLLQRQLKMA